MPKLESPFKRVMDNNKSLVIPEINPGYEWVFDSLYTICTEKLDGTNVSILMDGAEIRGLANRANRISFSTLETNKYIDGVRLAYSKGRVEYGPGQYFGELMGPKIQKNFLKLEQPEWFPFSYLQKNASYDSFDKYPKTFENLSSWLKNDIFSLVYRRLHGDIKPPEGVVFYNTKTGQMAKLRRDMFDWYKGEYHNREN